jgi:DNA-directed RNA polymerase I, II, and III subunit RPABC1
MENAKNVLHEILTECRHYDRENDFMYKDLDGKAVKIVCAESDKLNIQIGKEYITDMLEEEAEHMIIIYHCITSSTQKLFSELNNYHIELFNIDELRFNLTKHKLVPTHIKLSDAQQQSFLQTFGEKIPIILKTDPISKIYDYKRNDIVKIIRPGNEVSYRICK